MTPLPLSAAAERNKHPILEQLQQLLPLQGSALEIAAGTGQHALWFADALPGWVWQPTDGDPAALPALAARAAKARHANIRPPRPLDVQVLPWSVDGPFDLVFCANMLHIAPWTTCSALMQGTAGRLAPRGQLVVYGPFLEEGVPTAPGNVAFDESLRARDPAWGLRRLADVCREAAEAGLALRSRRPMPANNLLLVFGRG
jgi:hypothetical protein